MQTTPHQQIDISMTNDSSSNLVEDDKLSSCPIASRVSVVGDTSANGNTTKQQHHAGIDSRLSTAILGAVIDPTLVINEQGIIVYFNPAACKAFLIPDANKVIGNNVSSLMISNEAKKHDSYLKNYKRTGERKMIGRNRTVTAKRSDGTTFLASLSISEVELGTGASTGAEENDGDDDDNSLKPQRYFVGTLRDVTHGVKREKLFVSVINEAIDAIFTIDGHGKITLANRSAQQMFGYTETELVGQNISILMPDPHRSKHDSYIKDHLSTGIKKMIGTDRTVTAQRKDGTQFQCRLGLSKIDDRDSNNNISDDPNSSSNVTFVGLLHDLTHELQAREADARAERADKMRKQKALFLASMSHEIRTPLNGIFGMLELLQTTQLTDVQSEWISTCSRSAQALTTILDDILLFSRADGGGITLERLSFNVRDVIEDAVTVLATQTDGRAVDLVYTISSKVPEYAIGDPTRLRQIILILLSNALKFTQVR